MSDDPLRFLARAPSDAPSQLLLDRYAANELSGPELARVESWLATHPEARATIDARKRFPAGVDPDALFARIQHNLPPATRAAPAAPSTPNIPWWQRLFRLGPALALVAAAALALFIVRPWAPSGPAFDPDELRAKGGFDFLVHRQIAGGSEVLTSGSPARAGDHLRFQIALSEARYVMIIDQDPSGALATAWPLDGSDAARLLPASTRALDGAVELDAALGREWLHAVACPDPLALSGVSASAPGTLQLPASCKVIPFLLDKVAR